MSLKSLSVSLLHSSGPLPGLLRLQLALQLSGWIGGKCAGSVAERATGFRDFDLNEAALRELCRLAEEAGLPGRAPRVEAVVDTSDSGARVLLQLAHESGAQVVDLALLSSGYEGPDAPALQKFCARLLTAAGVRDGSIWHDLTGGEPA